MQYAPTRARAKFGRFHIFPSGYAKNAPDFPFPNRDAPKNAPRFTLPNRDTPKTRSILYPNRRRGYLRGVCNTPLHGYVQNLAGFIFPHPDAPKNAPDFTLSNKDIPKSCPVLDPNLWRGTFWGRMQYAPTRVRAKPARFHISPPEYTKNPPDFTLPNKDTPKSCPVLGLNRRRGAFRGVCFCALHGYMKNLAGFTFSQ